jgi:hypothetical protein
VTGSAIEALAEAICDAWWETSELPHRWSTTVEYKRQTFRNCAQRALLAGKAVNAGTWREPMNLAVAKAICVGFHLGAGPQARTWEQLSESQRTFFLVVAGRAIAAGQQLKTRARGEAA